MENRKARGPISPGEIHDLEMATLPDSSPWSVSDQRRHPKIVIKEAKIMMDIGIVTIGPITANLCSDAIALTCGDEVTLPENTQQMLKDFLKNILGEHDLLEVK